MVMAMGKKILLFIILISSITGCAGLPKVTPDVKNEEPVEVQLSHRYLMLGSEQEKNGDLVQADQSYTLALTIEPENPEARNSKERVEMTLSKLAEDHYQQGLSLYQKGQYGQSRKHLLTALQYRPDYQEVIKLLTTRKRIPITRYIEHTIKEGESLSKIAKIYYGDQTRFPVIAQYNNLTDASLIYVGQKIKIPEIEGITLKTDQSPIQTTNPYGIYFALNPTDEGLQQVSKKDKEEEEISKPDQIALHRNRGLDLFHKDKYKEAIIEFNRVLALDPNDKASIEYRYKSHYLMAVSLYENQDFLAAKTQFRTALEYNKDCMTCKEYMEKSEEQYKETHYKKGMEFYGKELLTEAIHEWEMVVVRDPGYKQVGYLINKAREILSKLEEIMKKQKGNAGN